MQKRPTFVRALADLERKHQRSKTPTDRPEKLVPTTIKTAPEVFQPRIIWGGDVDSRLSNSLVALSCGAHGYQRQG